MLIAKIEIADCSRTRHWRREVTLRLTLSKDGAAYLTADFTEPLADNEPVTSLADRFKRRMAGAVGAFNIEGDFRRQVEGLLPALEQDLLESERTD
jgi:hypothetical protein